ERAPNGVGRSFEQGEESVAGRADLTTVVDPQLLPDRSALRGQQASPALVAELAGQLRRPDHIGEQDRAEGDHLTFGHGGSLTQSGRTWEVRGRRRSRVPRRSGLEAGPGR